jgi:hypothetical protein
MKNDMDMGGHDGIDTFKDVEEKKSKVPLQSNTK